MSAGRNSACAWLAWAGPLFPGPELSEELRNRAGLQDALQQKMGLVATLTASPASAQVNVTGWHARGQTWIVWDETAPVPHSYRVFATTSELVAAGSTAIVRTLCRVRASCYRHLVWSSGSTLRMRNMRSSTLWRTGRVAALSLAGCLGASCASFARDVRASQDDFFTSEVRASYDLTPARGSADEAPPRWRKIRTIEVDLGTGSGEDSQTLNPTEFISFAGARFDGPLTVASRYDLAVGSLAVRLGANHSDKVSIAGVAGIGVSELELELSAPGQVARDTTREVGPLIGVQFDWHARPWLDLSIRRTLTASKEVQLSVSELVLRAWPGEHIGVFAGWRVQYYTEERPGPSDVELQLAGPTAGLYISL